ncbi:DUF3203 family protein [Pseudomonas sp. S75]|uniref:DUF3203 family protein n=1 Tax=unclassified Pseudomonas TaxID=196821 RepID=UPI001907F686|nr:MULTISPECIES: DUF3203 family protein [unclassified Pseudomonas]MBJ9973873.1 DUF3203 family protein [Pseudomonas sp. S30]MBK0152197.1 DUF3203 family protein [Pseudomonas sp. S75]
MPVRIDDHTHCTLIGDTLTIEGLGHEVQIVTDERLRLSVAVLAGERFAITEAEADALMAIGAADHRRHLIDVTPGSIV